MNQAPFFNAQFFDDDGTPLEGGRLFTYASGTTTPQATYEDQAGGATNTNPIILDAAGRCDLWLDPELEYTFRLERSDFTLVKTFSDVVGVAGAASVVTSVNSLTGAVALTAEEVPFTTGTSTLWFAGTDVAAALDDIITKVNDLTTGSTTAADVAIVDSGANFTASNVETALAELADNAQTFALPSQTGNSGEFLTTNGTAAAWSAVALPTFTAAIVGGNISASVAAGDQLYGSRSISVSGGTAPYTYAWVGVGGNGNASLVRFASGSSSSTDIYGNATAVTLSGTLMCFVTDATGRMTSVQFTFTATHAA